MSVAAVTAIHVYPVKAAPGADLAEVGVEVDGLDGDRRKKAPVHLVAREDVGPDTRANFVVSLGSAELLAAIGSGLRVGEVALEVTGTARDCPGVYAAVRRPGVVRVGDGVEIELEPRPPGPPRTGTTEPG